MNLRFKLLLLIAVASPLAVADSASAQCGGYGGYGYGGFWDIGRLYRVLADNVPYYSAFPPVYYSYPVPRTYGYSPFAYPPGYTTPDVYVESAPLSINNPHVEDALEASPKADGVGVDRTADVAQPEPLVINNPFVKQSGDVIDVKRNPILQASRLR